MLRQQMPLSLSLRISTVSVAIASGLAIIANLPSEAIAMAPFQTREIQSGDLQRREIESGDLFSMEIESEDLHPVDIESGDLHPRDIQFGELHSTEIESADLHPVEIESADLQVRDIQSGEVLLVAEQRNIEHQNGDQHKDAHSTDAETVEVPEVQDAGLVVIASPYSVAETGDRFEALLNERGVTVFARIDHAAGAAGVELDLRPTEVIIFGNPRVGTPLMQCAQSTAIDLPQKLLIWQNEAGDVYLGYNDPRYLASRHGIAGCEEAIARVEQVLMGLVSAVVEGGE